MLERGQVFPFELPSQRPCILTFERLRTFPRDNTPRADLAIGREDIRIERDAREGRVSVTVHNIGIANASSTDVRLLDEDGTILAQTTVPPIDWPEDLTARTETVHLAIPEEKLASVFEVWIDPDQRVPDNVRLNNRLRIQAQAN